MPGVDRYSAAKTVTAAALWILATATPVRAQTDGGSAENPPEPFTLSVPLECPEGQRCWIVAYPDRDKSRNALDYNCGRLTKDRQRGSDFTIDGIDVMRQRVPVVASARGVVVGVRRNMKDAFDGTSDSPVRSKKPCGNGVLIEHPGDWTTQYCHLRKGSVRVVKGQEVEEGERLGLMGLSGKTEFPHLTFTVRLDKRAVDPFVGPEHFNDCGPSERQLWKSPDDPALVYLKIGIAKGGFSDLRPSLEGPLPEHKDKIPVFSRQARAIYLWADFSGLRPGDEIWFRVFAPNGDAIFKHRQPIKRYRYAKRVYVEFLKRWEIWPDGLYRGTVTLRRRRGVDFKDFVIERTVEMR